MYKQCWGVLCLTAGVCLATSAMCPALGQTPLNNGIQLQTPDQANARIRELAGSALPGSKPARIGPGDLIGVEVFDVPELSREARVSDSGFISMPLVGVPIQISGLTTAEAEEKISEILQAKGLVTHPEVIVSVKDQKSQPITVIGEVKNPQVIQAVRPMRLLEVLSAAGGIADYAGNTVLVTRNARDAASSPVFGETGGMGGPSASALSNPGVHPAGLTPVKAPVADPMPDEAVKTLSVKLTGLLDDPNPDTNIELYGGDIVTVPRGGIIYVVGAVNHPGGFVLQSDADRITTMKALALAAGQVTSAKLGDAVILRPNKATGKDDVIKVNLTRIMDRKIEDVKMIPNDVLFVPDSAGKRALHALGAAAVNGGTGAVIYRAVYY
jgi:polysaccharide biosynthesis/export protein